MIDNRTTELLHKLLDERGVKWWETINHANCIFTWWDSPTFGTVHTMDNEDGETLFMACLNNCDFTPEQAIAATLGSGTCENLSSMNVDGVAGYHFICSECGLSVCASMGIGEIEPSGSRSFRWKVDGRYEFERCPRCGKAVKR